MLRETYQIKPVATQKSRLSLKHLRCSCLEEEENRMSSTESPAQLLPLWPARFNYEEFLEEWEDYGLEDPDVQQFLQSLVITKQQQREIMTAPQRSDLWFAGRGNRLTASNFGAVAGQNPHSSLRSVLKNMLWPRSFSCAATQWGQDYESTAADLFSGFLKTQDPLYDTITFPGLVVSVEKPWLGASPDACVFYKNGIRKGLEIKCPFKKELYPFIPAYYYAQIQGTCGLLGFPSYFFTVWTPKETRVEEYAFDRAYFWEMLMPKMEEYYFLQYLPRAVLKVKGILKPGQIMPDEDEEEDEKPAAAAVAMDFVF